MPFVICQLSDVSVTVMEMPTPNVSWVVMMPHASGLQASGVGPSRSRPGLGRVGGLGNEKKNDGPEPVYISCAACALIISRLSLGLPLSLLQFSRVVPVGPQLRIVSYVA
jgi:hypothetical protein